ncbi:MAG: NAD+ synthase [Gammaproteobacteria bacterium]
MSTTDTLRICVAQRDFLVGDVQGNVDSVIEASHTARDTLGCDCIVFPELALTGYPPEDLLLRPGLRSAVETGLTCLLEEVRGITAVVGHPRYEQSRCFNSVSVIRDGQILAVYDKHELPNYGVFDEQRYFTPGASAAVFDLAGVSTGLTVCEDIWYPGPAAMAVEQGARLLLNLNASPFHLGKGLEREATVTRRVEELGVPVVYANLVGGQDELVFDGGSFVMDAGGAVHMRAPLFAEGLYTVDLDIAGDAPKVLPGSVEPYGSDEEQIYDALVTGVRDYVGKNGFSGAVLGLSGGIDSALTLAVAADALGPRAVQAVMMPSRYTADISRTDAAEQARRMGVDYSAIPIAGPVEAFEQALAPAFAGMAMDVTEENIQARSRGVILMALSNKTGRMLLTTGNKSEMAVGYATLYGDMAGGFAPLKDCPKTLVYRLARYRNSLSEVIPERVIERPPSAELRPDQKDSDSLPEYDVLDPILERFVERDMSVASIVADGFDPGEVERIATLVLRNEYKRRQAPPGVRITRRAFGRDRRYPITSGYLRGIPEHR